MADGTTNNEMDVFRSLISGESSSTLFSDPAENAPIIEKGKSAQAPVKVEQNIAAPATPEKKTKRVGRPSSAKRPGKQHSINFYDEDILLLKAICWKTGLSTIEVIANMVETYKKKNASLCKEAMEQYPKK